MIKRIDIGGIERQLSVSNMADGSMYGMVGARHLDGNIRPAQGLDELSDVSLSEGDRLVYVHRYGEYCHYIVETEDGGLVYETIGGRERITDYVGEVKYISSIGNALVVSTSEKMYVWVWNDDRYVLSSSMELPYIGIRQRTYAEDSASTKEYYEVVSDEIDITPDMSLGRYSDIIGSSYPTYIQNKYFRQQLTEVYGGLISNYREKAANDNILVDSYLVRYGLRMYDGNYLYVSPPIMIKGEAYELLCKSAEFNTAFNNTPGVWEKFQSCYVKGNGYKLYADFRDVDVDIMQAGIVVAIDIFMSAPIAEYDSERQVNATLTAKQIGGNAEHGYYEIVFGSTTTPKIEDIERYFNYYRVYSAPIDDVKSDIVELDLRDKIGNVLQHPLLENNSSVHRYVAESMMSYNGRIHIGGVTEKLFSGYPLHYYTYLKDINSDDVVISNNGEYRVYVYLRDGVGEYIVESKISAGINNVLSSYISYPDSRAYKMEIMSNTDYGYFKCTLLLKQHPFANESYYFAGMQANGTAIDKVDNEITEVEYIDFVSSVSVKEQINRNNVLKVSELNNPLVWPNDKTYTVGSGNIVSMAVATKAMSQGQFGQYPLYVFTSEGIYAMLSGGGDVLYSHVAPVNRHIVENAKTVCSLDDAVVFCTRQGLFVMSGGDTVKISTSLDDHGIVRNNRGIETVVATRTGETLTEMTTMRSLIAEGMVSYDYINEEILFYKPGNLLCYAYSLRSKMWQSYKRSVDYAVNSYPDLLLVDGKKVLRTSDEDSLKVEPEFLLVTNGMQLSDAMSSKRIERIHLLGHFAGNGEDSKLLLAVAGSNDGEEYALTYEQEYKVCELHNVTLPHSASAYRYVSLIVYGKNLDKRSYLNGIVVEYDDKRQER